MLFENSSRSRPRPAPREWREREISVTLYLHTHRFQRGVFSDVPTVLRVPASCVAYVPEAQGSCCATVRTPYAYQPRPCRTYRVPWHHR
eukprot:scaffold118035_cov63-Phaeocystis_antarctica.AAC.3